MIQLQLATRNLHKTREMGELLGAQFILLDLMGHPEIAPVNENGATFAENARLKAVMISRQLPGLVLADDSGLEVDSLGGEPGIFSARYEGESATDAQNRKKLLAKLGERPFGSREAARFHCVLALARAGELVATFSGSVEGEIIDAERGENGFGYDSLFRPDGFEKTFAELSSAEKNPISHRGVAAQKLREFLLKGELKD